MNGKPERPQKSWNNQLPEKLERPESSLRHYNNETKHSALTGDADGIRNVNNVIVQIADFFSVSYRTPIHAPMIWCVIILVPYSKMQWTCSVPAFPVVNVIV
jgi:hypothetical protein